MRRVASVCVGALACLLVIGLSHADAQEDPTPTSTTAPTTTVIEPSTTTTSTTLATTTSLRATTSTTAARGAVPPPAAGPTQTLVPDLLGTPVDLSATTTTSEPFGSFTSTTFVADTATATIAASNSSPSGLTLILATVAWLASFGGLLVYAEERRASRWKHLAR